MRLIRKPVVGTVLVAKNDVAAPTGWTLDSTTGLITFTTAPAAGVVVTAGYEFDVPVRFEKDELDISVDAFEAGSIPSVNVIEIRV